MTDTQIQGLTNEELLDLARETPGAIIAELAARLEDALALIADGLTSYDNGYDDGANDAANT